jgi:uncharacterized protein with HEPN domain
MRLETKKLLFDVQEAAALIASFVSGKSFTDYLRDPMLRSAVERKFEIIGEALKRLARSDPEVAAQIPDHREIVDFRNVLSHGYDVVQDDIVWGTMERHLPTLAETVERLLAS